MNLQETLTKENFWDAIMEQYPEATKLFCEWIDEYKEAVNWKLLFNEGATGYKEGSAFKHKLEAPKFHHIPHAMQQGIWIEFVSQTLNNFFEQPEYSYSGHLEDDIKIAFAEIEDAILYTKQ